MAKKLENISFQGTGRRKESIARVILTPGKGEIKVNGVSLDEYFGSDILKVIVNQPFNVTGTVGKYDVTAKVIGGGLSGQAGAIRHGIARALLEDDSEAYRSTLKNKRILNKRFSDERKKEIRS